MKYIKNLTNNQKKVLDFIVDYINKNKKPPIIEEIRQGLNFKSTRSVSQYLETLVKKGYISKSRKSRSIELVNYYEDIENTTELIPVLGTASCGTPEFFADNNIEEHICVDKGFLKNNKKNYYLLRSSGTSMLDAGIDDDSLVLVEQKDYYNQNDNVVAVIDGKATIKKMFQRDSAILLMPVTPDKKHKPIIIKDNFNIAGKVVCSIPDPASIDPDGIRVVPLEGEMMGEV